MAVAARLFLLFSPPPPPPPPPRHTYGYVSFLIATRTRAHISEHSRACMFLCSTWDRSSLVCAASDSHDEKLCVSNGISSNGFAPITSADASFFLFFFTCYTRTAVININTCCYIEISATKKGNVYI
jgi:hypothetical protein